LGFCPANSEEDLIRGVATAGTSRTQGIITSEGVKKQKNKNCSKNGMRRECMNNLLGKCLRKLI